MVFSSEKKELWRYASINNANCSVGVGNSRQQQLHRHQPLHHLQNPPPDYYTTTTVTAANNGRLSQNPNLNPNQQKREREQQVGQGGEEEVEEGINTPPPPYSSVPCGIDCSDTCRMSTTSIDLVCGSGERFTIGGMTNYINGKSRTLRSASNKSIASFVSGSGSGSCSSNRKKLNMERNEQHDCYYTNNKNNLNKVYNTRENGGAIFNHNVFVYDQLRKKKSTINLSTPNTTTATAITVPTTSNATCTAASVLVATAASIFRNCCGGGGGGDGLGEESKNTATTSTPTIKTMMCHKSNNNSISSSSCNLTVSRQYFDALLKQMKEGQVTALLKAVKSRIELVSQQQKQHLNHLHHHQNYQAYEQQQTHCCILIQRTQIMNEDPYVIVCRLFFWPKLKDASDLKRLPDCLSFCDTAYVCCNPLHWYRIVSAGMSQKI